MAAVTIALTTYNGARFLGELLDSLLAQTMRDFEVVARDDGSQDETWDILSRYAAADARVRIARNERTLGLQRNFEAVIAEAKGDWIAPCDQDDVWAPDKLDVLLEAARRSNAALVYSDSELVDADGRSLGRRAFQTMTALDAPPPLAFAFQNCVSGHALLFARRVKDVALPFPDLPIYDWWLAVSASVVGPIVRVDRPLVLYRQHDANVTDMLRRRKKSGGGSNAVRRERDMRARLISMARLPGPVGEAYGRLAALWDQRYRRMFVPELAVFAWRNRRALWAVKPGSTLHDLLRIWRIAKGVRSEALGRPDGSPST